MLIVAALAKVVVVIPVNAISPRLFPALLYSVTAAAMFAYRIAKGIVERLVAIGAD